MTLRCSFHKNLSAFLDGELDSRERAQMEQHISECMDCRREAEKLRVMIGFIEATPRPEVPADAWTGTLRKIEAASEKPARARVFKMPKWGAIPAAAAVFALLLFLGSQMFWTETESISVAAYLQEHELSYSQQVLSPDFLSDITTVQTDGSAEDTGTDEPMSELDMLVEVHYGIYSTNGS